MTAKAKHLSHYVLSLIVGGTVGAILLFITLDSANYTHLFFYSLFSLLFALGLAIWKKGFKLTTKIAIGIALLGGFLIFRLAFYPDERMFMGGAILNLILAMVLYTLYSEAFKREKAEK